MNDSSQRPGTRQASDGAWEPPAPPIASAPPTPPPPTPVDTRPAPPVYIEVPPEPGGRSAGLQPSRRPGPQPVDSTIRSGGGSTGSARQRRRMFAAIGGALMVVVAGAFGYVLLRGDGEQTVVTEETTPTSVPASTIDPTLSPTQREAASLAASSLKNSSDSRQGLIDYLVYLGYLEADATIAVDSLGVDWIDQARIEAKRFLEGGQYSFDRLLDQLTSDAGSKFPDDQATAGIELANGDWNAEAVEAAEEYIEEDNTYTFSCWEMISVLVNDELFTEEQAEYGASKAGLC